MNVLANIRSKDTSYQKDGYALVSSWIDGDILYERIEDAMGRYQILETPVNECVNADDGSEIEQSLDEVLQSLGLLVVNLADRVSKLEGKNVYIGIHRRRYQR